MKVAENVLLSRRLGLGPRPGDDLASAPLRDVLLAEIDGWVPPATEGPVPPSVRALEHVRALGRDRKGGGDDGAAMERPRPQQAARAIYRAAVLERYLAALAHPTGFSERMVWFWSNHFCVSALKAQPVRAALGGYEREVVRTHLYGRFADMLKAATTHPAMLFYLDNHRNFGPNSRAGQRKGKGLNENLGRELLELHTLGVGGGYTQDDVTEAALVLTGWRLAAPNDRGREPGTAIFVDGAHEPGARRVLGRDIPEGGEAQLDDLLDMLAAHPATARRVATKLATAFVADTPPPGLVARLEATFLGTGGDLAEIARTLVAAPETVAAPAAKIRTPEEFLVAAMRALGQASDDPLAFVDPLQELGQPTWSPPAPDGFPASSADWATATGLLARARLASDLARNASGRDPREVADAVFAGTLSPETMRAIGGGESREQALAILLMSPEFQRR